MKQRKLSGCLDGLELWVAPDGSAQLRTALSKTLLHIEDDPVRVVWLLSETSEPAGLTWSPGQRTTSLHLAILRSALDLDGVTPGRDLLTHLATSHRAG
jgi:hypothetical protein